MRCTVDDMLTQVNRTMVLIKQVTTPAMLILLEGKVDQIASFYRKVSLMPYWVNKLRTALLQKKCELLTRQYSDEETA